MNFALKISDWIKQKAKEAGAKGCVLGLSGGVDSAVAALLCKKAFPDDTLALILPCHSVAGDLEAARGFAERFGIRFVGVDLSGAFGHLYSALEGEAYKGEKGLAVANLKPRLRMAALYYFANKLNYLVVGTGNRSELQMGYFTKYGDGGVDLLPLGDLLKTQVRELAKELGVPREIIDKAPSAGLWPGQTDEGEMGITYAELDRILSGKIEGIAKNKIEMVRQKGISSRHKRQLPEIFSAGGGSASG